MNARPRPEDHRYGFVLGTGRCGSTVVHEVLARHPDAAFLSNVQDISSMAPGRRWNNMIYRRVPARFTQKGRLRYAPSEGYRLLDRVVSPILSSPSRDLTEADVTPWLQQRFEDFFREEAERQGLPLFLHKFTGWPRARLLHAVFPEARYINIIRDGRAVANSWLQMPWWRGHLGPSQWHFGPLPPALEKEWESSGRSLVLLAGLAWKLLMDTFEETRAALPSDLWLDVRFEDVVAAPRQEFGRMLDFLGLEWTAGFERGFEKHSFSTSRTQAFKRDLTADQVVLLTVSMQQQLQRYGYEPSTEPAASTERPSNGCTNGAGPGAPSDLASSRQHNSN